MSTQVLARSEKSVPGTVSPRNGKLLELDPVVVEVPVQILIYTAEEPEIYEGSAQSNPDGSTTIVLPIDVAPPPGTPIQIILYEHPYDPTMIEGVTTTDDDGSVGIDIPDGLLL